jgi:hypothetical protein
VAMPLNLNQKILEMLQQAMQQIEEIGKKEKA